MVFFCLFFCLFVFLFVFFLFFFVFCLFVCFLFCFVFCCCFFFVVVVFFVVFFSVLFFVSLLLLFCFCFVCFFCFFGVFFGFVFFVCLLFFVWFVCFFLFFFVLTLSIWAYLLSKQLRPWSDAASCGVWSGSLLFDSIQHLDTLPQIVEWTCWKFRSLILVLMNPDIFCLYKQCRSGFWREEANWSISALFIIRNMKMYQQPGSSNLIGWQLEMGVAS